jgi:hypothetical protein
MIEPFVAMGSGFKDMFAFARPPENWFSGPSRGSLQKEAAEKKEAEDKAKLDAWLLYDIFKKVNKFYTPL